MLTEYALDSSLFELEWVKFNVRLAGWQLAYCKGFEEAWYTVTSHGWLMTRPLSACTQALKTDGISSRDDKEFAFCIQLLGTYFQSWFLKKRMRLSLWDWFTHKLFFYRGDVASISFVKTKDFEKHLFYYVRKSFHCVVFIHWDPDPIWIKIYIWKMFVACFYVAKWESVLKCSRPLLWGLNNKTMV